MRLYFFRGRLTTRGFDAIRAVADDVGGYGGQ